MSFAESYLGKLRQVVGSRVILMPGARIVVHDRQGRVLLELRKDFGRWGVPGGNGEVGEDMTTTIIREVFEETGLRIKRPAAFGLASDPKHETITYPNGHVTQNFSLLFHVAKPKGALKFDPGEALDIGWFAPRQLPEDIMPNSLRTLKAYWRFQKTGKFQMI